MNYFGVINMKRLITIIFVGLFLFTLTGCANEQKEALQSVIDQKIESEDAYTPESYQNYLSALEAAKITKDKTFPSKKDIVEAQGNLQKAIHDLYIKPDKTDLIAKLDDAQKIALDGYLPNSTSQLKNAMTIANNVISDENALKENIDNAITEIDYGIKALISKPDKSNLSLLIKKAESVKESKYTTASCNALKSVTSNCKSVLSNENSTEQDITRAEGEINDSLKGLVLAKNVVYRINCSLNMMANLSVGNEWLKSIEYNGKNIQSGSTIIVPINSGITIKGTVMESDSVPDIGSGSVYLTSSDNEKTTEIYVRENRGRYSGNFAIWELTCSAEVVERV